MYELFDYEIRIDFRDGTFEVVTIKEARSISEALQRAGRIWPPSDVEKTTLLATIDRLPAIALAFPPLRTASERIRAARV